MGLIFFSSDLLPDLWISVTLPVSLRAGNLLLLILRFKLFVSSVTSTGAVMWLIPHPLLVVWSHPGPYKFRNYYE